MFDEKLPYRVYDADNHFYEPPGILEKYLEAKFQDRVAVDYTPEKAAQHNAKIRAEQERLKKEGGLIPGMALNKMNPLRDKSAEERALKVPKAAQFEAMPGLGVKAAVDREQKRVKC